MEEYFKSGKSKNRPLKDPMAAEFGIYNDRDLDEFILNYLPTFALVRLEPSLSTEFVVTSSLKFPAELQTFGLPCCLLFARHHSF